MVLPKEEVSNPLCHKNDSFTSKKKTRILESGLQRLKGEAPSSSKILEELSSTSSFKYRFGSPYLDPQLKLKLQALTPRNAGKETAEGVQHFINHVSNLLEKKNPFKEKLFNQKTNAEAIKKTNSKICQKSEEKEELKIIGKSLQDQKSLKDGSQVTSGKKDSSSDKKAESKDSVSKRRVSAGSELRKSPQKSVNESSESYKKHQSAIGQRNPRPVSSHETTSTNSIENLEKVSEAIMQLRSRKNRPSEIPLRKNRRDLVRKIISKKPMSLTDKFLKDVESNSSIDFMQMSFSEMENSSIISSSEEKFANLANIDSMDVLQELPNAEQQIHVMTQEKIGTNRNSESYIPDHPYELVGTKSKILDLAKIKSSSFTILNNNSFLKLENYHQQNLATKDSLSSKALIPCPSSKIKVSISKTSFNSLKKKGSKKNLSSRLSSKGNKPALKVKAKKFRKGYEEEEPSKICKQISNLINMNDEALNDNAKDNLKKSNFSSEKLEERADEVSTVIDKLNLEIDLIKSEITISKIDNTPVENEDTSLITPKTPEGLPKDPCSPQNNKLLEKPSKTFVIEKPVKETIDIPEIKTEVKSAKKPTQSTSIKRNSKVNINLDDLILKGTALFKRTKSADKVKNSENTSLEMKISEHSRKSYEKIREPKTLMNDWVFPDNFEIFDLNGIIGPEKTEETNEKTQADEESSSLKTPKSTHRNSISLERKMKPTCSATNIKEESRQKSRSDAGDRWLFRSIQPFNSAMSFQNKVKTDAKLRSSLTKSYIRENKGSERKDIFEESAAVKLKRRNSEPDSFRGFIWKRADLATPRDNHASVSSMASSLRHLNTDELEDFIFWEALPQKMTSCWEMSLYHFKRPWSVLSCSIFKDNRESSTPGSILQSLRNGGARNDRHNEVSESDRMNPKENSFDVEPSIAQKNIDIRNWLAALNFQALPSTSADAIREGNFCTQPVLVHQHFNKNQINPKRRKVFPSLKFHDDLITSRSEEKSREKDTSSKWNVNEVGGLMDLIRRKSGGFVTAEQFLNPELSTCQNLTFNYCTCSSKEMVIQETQTDLKPEPANGDGIFESSEPNIHPEEQPSESSLTTLNKSFAQQWTVLPSDINIYKYLFIMTLCIFIIHLFFGEKAC